MNEVRNASPVPAVGTRVRTTRPIDRYPHFVCPVGREGTVVQSDDDQFYPSFYVWMDDVLEGAEEWENQVEFIDDTAKEWKDDLEVIGSPIPHLTTRTWLGQKGESGDLLLDGTQLGKRVHVRRWLEDGDQGLAGTVQVRLLEGDGRTIGFREHRGEILLPPVAENDVKAAILRAVQLAATRAAFVPDAEVTEVDVCNCTNDALERGEHCEHPACPGAVHLSAPDVEDTVHDALPVDTDPDTEARITQEILDEFDGEVFTAEDVREAAKEKLALDGLDERAQRIAEKVEEKVNGILFDLISDEVGHRSWPGDVDPPTVFAYTEATKSMVRQLLENGIGSEPAARKAVTDPGKIETVDDARKWFRALLNYGVNFHPDDEFEEIVHRHGGRVFTDEEAQRMNAAMAEAELAADEEGQTDVYSIALEVTNEVAG